jgi:hypothetical protein
MAAHTCGTFYEYYFEPTGKDGVVFFQFMNKDFEAGMRAKKTIEEMVVGMNVLVITLILAGIVKCYTNAEPYLLIGAMFLWSTTLLNSIDVMFHQIKNQAQFLA